MDEYGGIMNTENEIKKMAKKFNICSRCGSGNFALEIGKDQSPKYDRVYVLCTECGNNMNAENMDRLLIDWNADGYKEPGSKEFLADENKKLKSRNERLMAENERLYKKLEEYGDKHLVTENRRLKTLVEELREKLNRVCRTEQADLWHLDPDELLNVYDMMRQADEGRRCAEHAKHPGCGALEINCMTWEERLA